MPSSELSWPVWEAGGQGFTLTSRFKQLRHRMDQAETAEGMTALAKCCFLLGYYEQAEFYWEKSLRLGGGIEARKWLAYYRGVSFQHWLKRYHKAVWEMERKHYAVAKELLSQLAGEFDQSVALFKLLGYAAWMDGDMNLASAAWQQGLRLDPDDADMNRYLSRLQGVAVKTLALQANPPTIKDQLRRFGHRLVGCLDKKHEKKILALGSLLLVFALASNFYAWWTLPESAPLVSDYSGSVSAAVSQEPAVYSTVIPELPYDMAQEQAAYDAGYAYYLAQEFTQAKEQFRVVLGMNQAGELRGKALFYLAHCCYELGDPAVANHFFTEFIMCYPGSPQLEDALYFSGLSYYNMNDGYSAKLRLKQLKNLYPNSAYLTRSDYLYILNS